MKKLLLDGLGMTDGTAEGGVISKEIKRIFQRVRENIPLEEFLSFKLLGLTICHDLSWESHISNLASKASRRLGILRRAKSFHGTPEPLTTYKAFLHSLME